MNTIDEYIVQHTSPENNVLAELNRETHLKMLMPRMLSGHVQGKMLEMISCMLQPKYILELGTYTGYSAICLAKGLQEGGVLHTVELNDEIETFIRKQLGKAGVEDKIKLHIGSALEVIQQFDIEFDLVFIDADKRQYPQYYDAVFPLVRKGGFIIADNVLWDGKVIAPIARNDEYTRGIVEFNKMVQNDERVENVIFPIRDGLMVVRKK